MSDHILKTIEDAKGELRKRELAVIESKRFINQLCKFGQLDLLFPEAEGDHALTGSAPVTIQRNAYYGRPLATCVRDFLEMRKRSGRGPAEASLEDIMEALKTGSFNLDAITRDVDGQKRGVAISLAKNNATFHKLPNGDFGLAEWYSNIRRSKSDKGQITNGGEKQSEEEQVDESEAAAESDVEEKPSIEGGGA